MGGDSENPYAGQGPVLLDIGGDMGALVVVMPVDTEGLEVELRPVGATATMPDPGGQGPQASHDHPHAPHSHPRGDVSDDHLHDHDHDHVQAHAAYPHVAVVARPDGAGVVHTLVYPSVVEGEYELFVLPGGPVVMTASVAGGQVTRNRWPA